MVEVLGAQLDGEIQRARRYGRPLTIGRMTVSGQQEGLARSAIRTTDEIARRDEHLLILWTETDREAGRSAMDRLVVELGERLPALDTPLDPRVASFPSDGLTRQALLDALDRTGSTHRASSNDAASDEFQPLDLDPVDNPVAELGDPGKE